MRIKQSRSRIQSVAPAPVSQRRRSKRRFATGSRGAPPGGFKTGSDKPAAVDTMQWLAFVAVGVISLALIILIWTLTTRSIADETFEIRSRADQQLKSVAFVLGRQIQGELQLIDQSLSIIQDNWNKDSGSVDLAEWRKKLLALTGVADDIFIANERGVIVQGTLPQSVGQGFGSAYVSVPNGSLETFDPSGTKNADGRTPGPDDISARQFLTYIVRPLASPAGWRLGASFRSEGITKLFPGAELGPNGVFGLVAVKRGGLQAVVGSTAQFARMDISRSELIEQIRKNESGVWTGASPIDGVQSIIAYQRVPGRDMDVLVGQSIETALQPVAGVVAMARGLAFVASLVVAVIAGILMWSIASLRAAKLRRRTHERAEIDLLNLRQELTVTRARALLNEAEAAALLGSASDGVARLDGDQRLRQWNARFAALSGVLLNQAAVGALVEDLFRLQANAGLFSDAASAEEAIATRLTILQTSSASAVPPVQRGPDGERITMHVRAVADGGHIILLAGQDNARLAMLPPVAAEESEPETAEW